MRNQLALSLGLFALVLTSSEGIYAQETPIKDNTPVLVEIKEKAFSIEIPGDWKKDKSREGIDFFAYAPVPASDQIALTNMGIVAGKVNKNLSLANFFKANVDNLPNALNNYEEISRGTGGIPNVTANWIIYKRTLSTEAGDVALEEIQYYLIAGEYGYVITFSATPNEFVANRGVFEKTVQTFKVLRTGEPSLENIRIFPGRKQ